MAKDTFYFQHDYHAHQDPKCSALIKDFGFAGYGLYWAIIEILHEQGGKIKKFPKLLDGMAFQLNIDKEYMMKLIEALLHDYQLLQQDQSCIWSDRVLRNLEERRLKSEIKAQAGRIGGVKSGELRRSKQNEAVLEANEAVLEANEQKERKGKEIKGNEIKETPRASPYCSKCKDSKIVKEGGFEYECSCVGEG